MNLTLIIPSIKHHTKFAAKATFSSLSVTQLNVAIYMNVKV